MNVVYTVLFALPIGLLVRPRATAVLTYLVLGSWVFGLQTANLLLSWYAHEGRPAFGPFPAALPAAFDGSELVAYAAVNTAVTAVGVGLVVLGHRVRARRAARRDVVVLA